MPRGKSFPSILTKPEGNDMAGQPTIFAVTVKISAK